MADTRQDIGSGASGLQANTIDTVNISTAPLAKGIPKYLTLLPAKNPNFIGRKEELQQIKDDLSIDSMVYIVNGIGGIGKSELAYKYLLDHEESYQHIALFKFSDASDTLENILTFSLKESLILDEDATLDSILYRLQNLPKKCLLVFDNVKNKADINKLSPLNNNCDVLITTRLSLSEQKCLNLDILPPEDARTLFQTYYPTEENIDDILEYIDYHSLFIELIAKTLREACLTLHELRRKFQEGEFAQIDRNFEKSFNDFLTQRFQIEDDKQLKILLQYLAILPSIEIGIETLEEIFDEDSRLKLKLNELANRGWLIQREGSYKLHQIIKEFILANHPASFADVSLMLKSISQHLDPCDAYLNPITKIHYIEIIESIIDVFSIEKNALLASLLDALCNLYHTLGRYNKALNYQKNALAIREKELGNKHLDTASSYNNLALVYDDQGKNSKALELYQKALEIKSEVLGNKHPTTATGYHNIAGVYLKLKYCKKALDYAIKAKSIYQ